MTTAARRAGDTAAAGLLLIVGLAFASAALAGRAAEWLATKFLNRGATPSPLDPIAAGATRGAIAGKYSSAAWADPLPGATVRPGGRFHDPDRPEHSGLDLHTSAGSPLYAPAAGTVTNTTDPRASAGTDCGGRVELRITDALTFGTCHLGAVLVSPGDKVRRGQMIARVAAAPGGLGAGNANAPHGHVYVVANGVRVDPAPYVGR